MPCNDVTESLVLRLDLEDRLAGYQLRKKSCGRAVGQESLLADEFAGIAAAEILAMGAEDFAERRPFLNDTDAFLRLKHLFALQGGLRVLLGEESGGVNDPVTIAAVAGDEAGYILDAEISVEVLKEKIKSCGNCKGCGVLKNMFADGKKPAAASPAPTPTP